MERKSRSELIKMIEEGDEKLARYEGKLRDVVQAYKNLHKEKEALEASIKVLTSCQQVSPRISKKTSKNRNDKLKSPATSPLAEENQITLNDSSTLVPVADCDHPLMGNENEDLNTDKKDEKDTGEADNEDGESEDDTNDSENIQTSSSEEKLTTLTSTLQTVMEQKTIMESSYLADKKKMMHEFEAKQNDLLNEKFAMAKKLVEYEGQITEGKQRMRQEQQSREEEENNNILMLRELQLLLSKERTAREELEQQLDEAKEKLSSSKSVPGGKALEYEHCIQSLREELEEIQRRLSIAEAAASQPSPLLLRIQKEMEEMKKDNAEALLREQKRANEAEERMEMITSVEESRVSDLETKLSELSEVVGNYEKLKFQDQLVIQKLKERLQLLDAENTALTQHSPTAEVPDNNRHTVLEIDLLTEQVYKLRAALKFAVQTSGMPKEGDLEGLSKSELDSILNTDPTHKVCQHELKQLKDEFELYKAKANPINRNKSFKDLTAQLENLDKIKNRNVKLERRLLEIKDESKRKESESNETLNTLKTELQNVEEHLTREKEECEHTYQQKLAELEKQVLKQRERTLELLAEKDAEINSLRTRSPSASPLGVGTGYTFSYPRRYLDPQLMTMSEGLELAEGESSEETNAAVCQLITRQAGVSSGEGALIHYAQQQARREAESTALRRQKIDLEDEMRDMTLREAKHEDQCETLKEEIRKLERDRSRESANLEYLKNIVLRFMLSTSYSVKDQMIVAIATILQFSPKEMQKVRKANSGGWWGST